MRPSFDFWVDPRLRGFFHWNPEATGVALAKRIIRVHWRSFAVEAGSTAMVASPIQK
jgi:hypothetical protein